MSGIKVLSIESRTFIMDSNTTENTAEIVIEALTWITVLLVFTLG